MRIVLDTNVLVSGLLSAAGPPGWIVEAVLTGDLELALDMAIREEYEEVLTRPEYRFPVLQVDTLLSVIDRVALWVAAAPSWPVALPDPDDEPFLAVAAVTGSAPVTGNARHFPVSCRRGVVVLTPRELKQRLARTSRKGSATVG